MTVVWSAPQWEQPEQGVGIATDIDHVRATVIDRGDRWSLSFELEISGQNATFRDIEGMVQDVCQMVGEYMGDLAEWADGPADPDA